MVRAGERSDVHGPRPRGRARGARFRAVVPRRRRGRNVRPGASERRKRRGDPRRLLFRARPGWSDLRSPAVAMTAAETGFDLTLTEEQELAQRDARDLATEKVLPLAAEVEHPGKMPPAD